jgi:hypothetical protein
MDDMPRQKCRRSWIKIVNLKLLILVFYWFFFKQRIYQGEFYFENSWNSFLNKLRIVLHKILRKDFIVFSKSQNHLVKIFFFNLLQACPDLVSLGGQY